MTEGGETKTGAKTGQCLCGAVRYRVAGDPVASTLCHCADCRRASGGTNVAWAVFEKRDFARLNPSPLGGADDSPQASEGRGTPTQTAHPEEGLSAAEGFIAAAEADLSAEALAKAEEGMAEMSKVYDETGRELYMGAGDREHD